MAAQTGGGAITRIVIPRSALTWPLRPVAGAITRIVIPRSALRSRLRPVAGASRIVIPRCPDIAVFDRRRWDHEDCDSEECPEVAVQNGGDDADDDEDCSSTTTTTTTTLPSIAPGELELTAIGAECFNDIPYLSYAIDFPAGQSATITFLNPNGADIVYEDQPLSGAVLWPGASESPPDWPGWILQDGVWVAADDGFLWARGNISVLFEVNPSTVLTVSYPQSTEACADPENIPDVVGGVVITPPTTPSQIGGVESPSLHRYPGWGVGSGCLLGPRPWRADGAQRQEG